MKLSQKYILVTLSLLVWFSPAHTSSSSYNRYEIECSAVLWWSSLDSAISQIGIKEIGGNNRGNEIYKYQKSVGIRQGDPYCYAGQYWSFTVARRSGELIPLARTGLASAAFNYCKKNSVPKNEMTSQNIKPQKGDIVFWKYSNSVFGHVERIIEVKSAGWITTVAFNVLGSKQQGSVRDGGEVGKKNRNYAYPLGRMGLLGFIGHKSK